MEQVTLSTVFESCRLIIPELILVAGLCVIVLADIMLPRAKSPQTGWIALGFLAVALLAVLSGYGDNSVFSTVKRVEGAEQIFAGPQYGFSRMLVADKLADFFKIIFLLGTIGVVIFSMRSVEIKDYRHGEYYTLMLGSVLGGSFLVSSNNFLMLVLSLETLSLCSYVLAGYLKHNRLSAEASLKYVLYGSVASGVMLFGISYIYGMAGTLDLTQVLQRVAASEDNGMAILLSMVLVIGGIGFKMAAVPFHFWAPDVYQGSPTPITAFLSVVSKAAGFAAVYRVLLPLFAVEGDIIPDDILAIRGALVAAIEQGHLPLLFWVLSVATMSLGNLVAIRQTDIKRLLAYSSIAHAGYLLMGLTVFNNESLEAMLFYFFAYMLMNLGAFLVVIVLINKTGTSEIEAYRGFFWKNPMMVIALFILLISLTGLPPTIGFIAKMRLFFVVVAAGVGDAGPVFTGKSAFYLSLAVIGGINTAISLYYYMRVMKTMIFARPKEEGPLQIPVFDQAYIWALTVPVVLLFAFFGSIAKFVELFQR